MKLIKSIILALCVLMGALQAMAEYTGPAVSMFYPGLNEESPMELKPTAKAYIYFVSGSKVVEVKATIEQNGQQLGSCLYAGTAAGVTTCTMDPNKPDNADMANIQPGLFTINFYEVTYLVAGEQQTYSQPSEPFASVTYRRNQSNGSITGESGLSDGVIKSYFPTDGTEGVKIYTFSKAVKSGAYAYLLYGSGDLPHETAVPCTLADDGLSLTLDLRGMCNNVETLAPGVVFTDDEGNPCDPPSSITLVVEALNCVDGTKINTTSTSLDGQFSATLEGKLYQPYHYVDLTFATPVITDVKFYVSAAPATMFDEISADTDMMAVYVSDGQTIDSADLVLTAGETEASQQVTIGADGVIRAAIPAAIKGAGSAQLVVSLENVVYNVDDGATHTIAPFDLGNVIPEMHTIAEILALPEGTACTVNFVDGIKVTYVNQALGYTFAEDADAGMMITTADYTQPLSMGALVTGKLVGTYGGGGLFVLNPDKSEYVETPSNIVTGKQIQSEADVQALLGGKYDNMLVTVTICEGFDASYNTDNQEITVKQGDAALTFTTMLIDDFEAIGDDDTINAVTGVVYCDVTTNTRYMLMRWTDDLDVERSGIAGVEVDASDAVYYDLRGIRQVSPRRGLYISKDKKILIK